MRGKDCVTVTTGKREQGVNGRVISFGLWRKKEEYKMNSVFQFCNITAVLDTNGTVSSREGKWSGLRWRGLRLRSRQPWR